MAFNFNAGQAGVFLQRNGGNTAVEYLGCHEIGDITIPEGDITLQYCPDPANTGKFIVTGSVQGQADTITTDITANLTDELDPMERSGLRKFTLFLTKQKLGRRDQFNNWDRIFVLGNTRVTERSYTGLSARSGENSDPSELSHALSSELFATPMRLAMTRQTISEAEAINSIVFCNEATERTDDSQARESCEVGYAAANAGTGVTANLLATTNGATWAATAADPLPADKHIAAVRCLPISTGVTRIIVARGTTTAATPAQIAYSDDGGATWVTVSVGATSALFAKGHQSLFVRDINDMWLAASGGYIYHSADGGLTWTTQEAGVLTTDTYNAIHFANADVGVAVADNNAAAITIDGGTSWAALATPAGQTTDEINTVYVFDKNYIWIGYSDGTLYYTFDGGLNWSLRSFTGSGAGQVKQIAFQSDLIGYMIHTPASGQAYLHMTVNGGYSWERLPTSVNSGLTAIAICDVHKIFVAGLANASTGFIAKAIA